MKAHQPRLQHAITELLHVQSIVIVSAMSSSRDTDSVLRLFFTTRLY